MKALRRAIVAICATDAQLAALTGRPTENMVARGDIGDVTDAGCYFTILNEPIIEADKDARMVEVQIDCYGKTDAVANDLADRVEVLLFHNGSNNLWAQSIDAAPMYVNQRDTSSLESGGRKMRRITVDLRIDLIKA